MRILDRRLLWANAITRRVGVEVLFEPRDLWVGIFWKASENRWGDRYWEVYVCPLPCFPVRFIWHRHMLPAWKRLDLRLRAARPGR